MLNYSRGAEELDVYYSRQGHHIDGVLKKIQEYHESSRGERAVTRKAAIHRIMAAECEVAVFPHFPFFWEIDVGRSRTNWGCDVPLSGYLKNASAKEWMVPYQEDIKKYTGPGLLHGWSPVGYDHHCPGYDTILEQGLLGIIAQAERRLDSVGDGDERAFLEAVINSNRVLEDLGERFAEAAEKLMGKTDDEGRTNLARIAAAARKVPANPAETFFEALSVILFIRENYGSFESFGQSTFGQIDRLLFPYYEKDLAAGRITYDEAYKLINELLSFTDAKWGINDGFYRETSTTLVIGGCDKAGKPVFNDITRMVIRACIENRYVGTKIIARVSGKYPEEYFSLLADFTVSAANVFVILNDDTIIPANRRWNKTLEDSRLYVGGGCHEIVLANTEVRTRADTWVNLPALFLQTLAPAREKDFDGFVRLNEFTSAADAEDFDSFYTICMDNVRRFHNTIAGLKEKYECRWNSFDAAPLYSASISDCIENARDVCAGGARYNSISLSMLGAATFIDSLYAVKHLVFDKKEIDMLALWEVLKNNWADKGQLRLYIINRLPKYGTGNPQADEFALRVMRDLSTVGGQPNGRGGIVTPSFYPHDLFRSLGNKTPATPDGREKGDYLSRGISPSEFVPVKSVTDILSSLKSQDLSLFPESMATEITLPLTVGDSNGRTAVAGLIKTFAALGGSTLQINVLDHETLVKAKKDPEKYPNLVVRICGYSQSFNSLSEGQKDEVISRAVRAV